MKLKLREEQTDVPLRHLGCRDNFPVMKAFPAYLLRR